MKYESTKIIELGSSAFRQWRAESHCRFIHGYRLIAKFWFGCSQLDNNNWVVDFGALKDLKSLLEEVFDHKLCVASDDPHIEEFKKLHQLGVCDLKIFEGGVGIEKFTEFCFNKADLFIRDMTHNRCWVEQVEVWEHEKNSASIKYNLADILPSCNDPKPNNVISLQNSEVNNVPQNTPRPAAVGNKVTTGWSNPFGGTSWGV